MTTEQFITALYQLISGAAVSATGGVHLYQASEAVLAPYVTFSPISDTPTQTHGGECGGVDRLQVDCYASTAELAAKIRDEINGVLSGYSGEVNGAQIGAILRTNSFNGFEDETNLYRQSTDYRISR